MTYKNGGTILHHMLTYDINQKYLESPSKNFIHKIPLLLARDVDVTRKDMDGNTALHLLVKSLGRYLRNDQQYSSFDRKRIQESIVSAAKQLIDKGADPKAKNKDGLTPLAYGISLEAYQKKAYEKYDITTDKLITYLKTLE